LRPRKSEKRSIVGSRPAEPWASCAAYKTAFSLLEEDMPPKHRLMLVVHYHAPARTVTARQLAALVGYAHYGAVNMQYGTLARGVCEILGQRLKYHVLVLVEFRAPASGPDRDLRWIMRPEVARALEELQWV